MEFESLFRLAFSNQSLRLYKKKSVSLVVRAVGFRDSAKWFHNFIYLFI